MPDQDHPDPAGAGDMGKEFGDAEYYQPPIEHLATDRNDTDTDTGGDPDWQEPGEQWTPGRLMAAGVSLVVVIVVALFLFTFTGATGSTGSGGGSAGGGTVNSVSATNPTSSATGSYGGNPPTVSLPSGATPPLPGSSASTPGSDGSRPTGPPGSSASASRPAKHHHVGTEPTRPSGPATTGTTPTSAPPQATVAQLLIAGNAEQFFHAVGTAYLAGICAWWDPNALSTYLSAVGVDSCNRLDPYSLAHDSARSAYATFTVTDPTKITITGRQAVIPAAAIDQVGLRPQPVVVRLDTFWRVSFTGAPLTPVSPSGTSSAPDSPTPTTTPPPQTARGSLAPVLTVHTTGPRR